MPSDTGLVNDDTNTHQSPDHVSHPQSRERGEERREERGEESPLMSKLANNHSQRNIIVFHPQCLMSFEIQPFVSVTL